MVAAITDVGAWKVIPGGRATTFRKKSRPPFSIYHSSIFRSSVLYWGRKVEKMENS